MTAWYPRNVRQWVCTIIVELVVGLGAMKFFGLPNLGPLPRTWFWDGMWFLFSFFVIFWPAYLAFMLMKESIRIREINRRELAEKGKRALEALEAQQ